MAEFDLMQFLNQNTGPVFLAAMIVLAAVIVIIKKSNKSDDMERPKLIEPDEIAYKEMRDICRTNGEAIGHQVLLRQGPITKGRIMRWSFYRHDQKLSLSANNKKNKTVSKMVDMVKGREWPHDNFFLLEVIPFANFKLLDMINTLFYKLLGLGANWYLADMKATSVSPLEYNISIFWQQRHEYNKVYVFSEVGKMAVKEMVIDKLTVKQILKDTVNHIPQMHYFDYKTGKFAAKARELSDLKSKSWKDREENLEKEVHEDL